MGIFLNFANTIKSSLASISKGGVAEPNKIDTALETQLKNRGVFNIAGKAIVEPSAVKQMTSPKYSVTKEPITKQVEIAKTERKPLTSFIPLKKEDPKMVFEVTNKAPVEKQISYEKSQQAQPKSGIFASLISSLENPKTQIKYDTKQFNEMLRGQRGEDAKKYAYDEMINLTFGTVEPLQPIKNIVSKTAKEAMGNLSSIISKQLGTKLSEEESSKIVSKLDNIWKNENIADREIGVSNLINTVRKEKLANQTPEDLQKALKAKQDAFRKEAGLMAKPYDGIGRVEYETPNGVFSNFSLGKTKRNMAKQYDDMVGEADRMLYENDPVYKEMKDAYEQKAIESKPVAKEYEVPNFESEVPAPRSIEIKSADDVAKESTAKKLEQTLEIKVPKESIKNEGDFVVAKSQKTDAFGMTKENRVTAKNIHDTVQELERRTTELKLLRQRITDRTRSKAKIAERNNLIADIRGSTKTKSDFKLLRQRITDRSKFESTIASKNNTIADIAIQAKDDQAVRDTLTKYIKKNLPLEERGKFVTQLRDIKSTEGEEKLLELLERIDERSATLAEEKALSKDRSRAKSTIAFIKKIGEMGGSVSKEVREKVGIEDWNKATIEQLQQAIAEFKQRLKFAYEKGFLIPTKSPSTVTQDMIQKVRQGVEMSGKEIRAAKYAKNKESAKEMVQKILQPIYDMLNDISPEIAIRMRNFEQTTRQLVMARTERVVPIIKKFQEMAKNKLSVEDWRELDYALKNRMKPNIDALVDKYGIRAEYDEAKKVLAEIVQEGKNYDKTLGELEDYWPRSIQWSDELAKEIDSKYGNILDMALRKREELLKRSLNQEDKEAVLNQLLRGFRQESVSISKAGSAKERMIDVIPPEWNKYYKDSADALGDYVTSMTEYIEQKKLFGQFIPNKEALKEMDASETIGHFVLNLLADGRVTDKQADIIKDALVARFNSKSPGAFINTLKNLGYLETMGSFFNMLAQLADLGISGYQNGWFRTLGKAVSPKKIKLEDLAINKFEDLLNQGNSVTTQAVKKVFDLNGISLVDRLTKETNINAVVSKWKGMANNAKKESSLLKELRTVALEQDIPKIIDGLKSDELNQEIKMALFNHLSKSQPISMGEYPEMYLKMRNGKVFYMLKSYQIKQLNMIRNEMVNEIKNGGGKLGALKKMVALTASLGIANATVSEIKDFMSGKETKFSDNLTDGMLKIYFYNRYLESKLKTGGVSGALQSQFGFPTRSADTFTKALFSGKFWDVMKKDIPRSVPVIGEPYYWWFGEGNEKQKTTIPRTRTTTSKSIKAKKPVAKKPKIKRPQ